MDSSPRRVADGLFRRDMLGPTFGNLMASMCGLLLLETVSVEFIWPYLRPTTELLFLQYGKVYCVFTLAFFLGLTGFWGFGTLFAIPAFLDIRNGKIQLNRSLDRQKLLEAMPLIFFNYCLAITIVPLAMLALPERSYDWDTLPSKGEMACQIVIWFIVEEVLFFYLHRFMHLNQTAYRHIHKIHHRWTAPVSYVAMYCHPLEQVLSNLMPLVGGPLVCGSHFTITAVYCWVSMIHTTGVHSGYWFCDDNGMHDEHHAKFTVNFGVTGILDVLHGTYQLPPGAAGKASEKFSTDATPTKKHQTEVISTPIKQVEKSAENAVEKSGEKLE